MKTIKAEGYLRSINVGKALVAVCCHWEPITFNHNLDTPRYVRKVDERLPHRLCVLATFFDALCFGFL